MPKRRQNKIQPVESQPSLTEGERRFFEELKKEEEEEGGFDQTLKLDSLNLAEKIEASFVPIEQKRQEQESVKGKKEEVEGLTSMSDKLDHITKGSLNKIKSQLVRYGIGVDEDFFSKQVKDLQIKLNSLEKELSEIKEEIEKKEQAQSEMSEQKKIIDILTDHNKLVRVNNKMKADYDYFVNMTDSFYSDHLQPLFDLELKGIGYIDNLNEVNIPSDETERKNLYENMKTVDIQRIIDEKTKEITGKFTELNSLILKFRAYQEAEIMLTTSFDKIMALKLDADRYEQKKDYIQKVKTELEETLNLDELEGYEEALPLVADFMGKSTNLDTLSEEAVVTIDENTKIFDKAKRELAELKLDFVDQMDKDIQNVKYVGNLEDELGTIDDLKDDISTMLNDSVKRLIFTSFINGIQKSNLTDYEADYNGQDYFIAYIYTLVYELGDISSSRVLVDFDDIRDQMKQYKEEWNKGSYN